MISIRIGRQNDYYNDYFFSFRCLFQSIRASQFRWEMLPAPLVDVFSVLRIVWQKTLLRLFRPHFQWKIRRWISFDTWWWAKYNINKRYLLLCTRLLIVYFHSLDRNCALLTKNIDFVRQQHSLIVYLNNNCHHWSKYETESGSWRDVPRRSGTIHGTGWGTCVTVAFDIAIRSIIFSPNENKF